MNQRHNAGERREERHPIARLSITTPVFYSISRTTSGIAVCTQSYLKEDSQDLARVLVRTIATSILRWAKPSSFRHHPLCTLSNLHLCMIRYSPHLDKEVRGTRPDNAIDYRYQSLQPLFRTWMSSKRFMHNVSR